MKEDLNKTLGIVLAVPGTKSVSPNRGFMFVNNFTHRTLIKGAEPPLYASKYIESISASTNDVYEEEGFEVERILRNDSRMVIIGRYISGKVFMREIPLTVETSEVYFGYEMKGADELYEGRKINRREKYIYSPSYNKDKIPAFGVNLTTMLCTEKGTTEDPVILSRTGAEKMTDSGVEVLEFSFDNNTVLKNLYGDSQTYKPFPAVGEKIINNQLLSKVSDDNIIKRNINKTSLLDNVIRRKGTIISLEIIGSVYSSTNKKNKEYTEVVLTNSYLNDIFVKSKKFDRDLLSVLEMYRYDELDVYTQGEVERLTDIYHNRFDYARDGIKLNNYILRIKIKKETPLLVGSKITGMIGNKSVVAEIREDIDMPITADGLRVELLIPSSGVVGRSIPALLNKSILWIGSKVMKHIEHNISDPIEAMKLIVAYYSIIDKYTDCDHVGFITEGLGSIDNPNMELLKEKLNHLVQPGQVRKSVVVTDLPMGGLDIRSIYEIYKEMRKLNVNLDKDIVYLNGERVYGDFEVTDTYIMRLKQNSDNKISATSLYKLDAKGLAIKDTTTKKKGFIGVSQSPQRIGVQESVILAYMLGDIEFNDMARKKKEMDGNLKKILHAYELGRGIKTVVR